MDIKTFKQENLAARIEKIEAKLKEGDTSIFCEHALLSEVIAVYEGKGWKVNIDKRHGSQVVLHLLDPSGPEVPEYKEQAMAWASLAR